MDVVFKKYMKSSVFVSILLVILSLFLIFKPAYVIDFTMIFLGMIVIINGFIHTVSYFSTQKEFRGYSFELIEGILCMIVGLLFILVPNKISSFLSIILGLWIIVESLFKIQLAFNIKTKDNKDWLVLVIISIITIIIGLVMILNPFSSIITITSFAGIVLLISETINLVEAFLLLRKI